MAHENDDDFYKLTFSQREGKASLPELMRLEHIPQRFRQLAWRAIENEIRSTASYDTDRLDPRVRIEYEEIGEDPYWASYGFESVKNIGSILESYEFEVQHKFHDEINEYGPEQASSFIKRVITQGDYHEVLTLVEFIVRHDCCSDNLRKELVEAFQEAPIAYIVDDKSGIPTILPRFSRESGEATQQALETLRQNSMEGSTTHLRQAAEHINAQQYGDSIADSIHAVEAVACKIDHTSSTLGQALKVLEKKGLLANKQLKTALEKLYAYTNSEEGARHSLVFQDAPDVGLEEAVFMFGACASFAAYLVNKHRQMKQQQNTVQKP